MLPVTLQFTIAMIAYAINERMARRVDYLQGEVRVLKEALESCRQQLLPVTCLHRASPRPYRRRWRAVSLGPENLPQLSRQGW